MSELPDYRIRTLIDEAHLVRDQLFRPIDERQKAGEAISNMIMVAAEYRAQRNALRERVQVLEQETAKLRGACP